jgi:hypothetical protein
MVDQLVSTEEALAQELRDPELRAEWERTARGAAGRLVRVASGLDIELMIDVRPQRKQAKLPKKRALDAGSFALGGCEVVLATA